MDFRTRLIRTLEAAEALLKVPGVIVIGSVVPNLLQAEGTPALVISEDVDLGVPISRRRLEKIAEKSRLKMRLDAEFFAAPCIALLHFAKEKEHRETAEAENP